MSAATSLMGALRPDPHVFKRFPRLEAHLDRSVLTDIPAAWADQDPQGDRYPMDLNALDGDCVAAWWAHGIESQARRQGPPYKDNIVPAAAVGTAYWTECSRQQGTTVPPTPPGPGLDPVQATVDWATLGFPGDGENLAEGACTINLNDPQLLRWCAWTFRGFGVALELPDDWQQTWTAPGPWEVSQPPDPMNGHMVMVGGYDETDRNLIYTWGTDKWAVPAWVPTYGSYGIVVLPDAWRDIPGVNVPTLEKELEGFGGQAISL